MSIWDDRPELIDLMRQCAKENYSAVQTAFKLSEVSGVKITKGSVSGKSSREGIQFTNGRGGGGYPRKKNQPCVPKVHLAPRMVRTGPNAMGRIMVPQVEVTAEPELITIPVEQRKTLMQLTNKTCHWPVGDPGKTGFFFCGGETVTSLPYCSYHCRVAFNPPPPRKQFVHKQKF